MRVTIIALSVALSASAAAATADPPVTVTLEVIDPLTKRVPFMTFVVPV